MLLEIIITGFCYLMVYFKKIDDKECKCVEFTLDEKKDYCKGFYPGKEVVILIKIQINVNKTLNN